MHAMLDEILTRFRVLLWFINEINKSFDFKFDFKIGTDLSLTCFHWILNCNIYTYPRLHYFGHNVLQCDECWEWYWDRPATPLYFDHQNKHTLVHIWIGLFFYHLQLMLHWNLLCDLDASAKLSYLAPRSLQKKNLYHNYSRIHL